MSAISLVTATFNAAQSLEMCLKSVSTQRSLFEHIIIDGCSTDSTLSIASSFTGHSLRIVSEPDNGIYDAMNKGIRLAEGEVIGVLNADDFYASSEVLASVAGVFEDNRVDACYGDLCYVAGADCRKIVRYWRSGGYDWRKMYWGWMPPHPTFFVRRRVYEAYGLFNLELGSAADYELMLRFLVRYRIRVAYIPEILVCMRTGGVSNATVANRVRANRMDRKAWDVNGLKPYPWTLWCKPLRKLPQYWRRPGGSFAAADWLKAE